MIGSLTGTVRGVIRESVVVDVGGVGYRVRATASVLAKASEGDHISLWTYLAVRENAQDLYGFETKEELAWFELLLTVSGVGPRSALAVLNAVDIRSLSRAISGNSAADLSKAYGVGKKTAEKIVLELREKVGSVDEGGGQDADVVEALVSLGYSQREARDAVRAIPATAIETESKIREAIRIASGTR